MMSDDARFNWCTVKQHEDSAVEQHSVHMREHTQFFDRNCFLFLEYKNVEEALVRLERPIIRLEDSLVHG